MHKLFVLGFSLQLCSCQIYPWGPETQWTRVVWPDVKLPFPYASLRKPATDKTCALHSSNGPYDASHYHRAAQENSGWQVLHDASALVLLDQWLPT